MIYESLIIGWLAELLAVFRKWYRESITAYLLARIAQWLRAFFSGSLICNFLWREGFLSRTWQSSLVFRTLDKLLAMLNNLITSIDVKGTAVLSESIAYRIIKAAASKTHVFTGLFIAFVLSVPHSRWSNLYSTIGVICLLLLFLLKIMTDRNVNFYLKMFDVFLFIFLVAVVLSEIFSAFPSDSMRFFIFYLTCFLLVLILVSSVNDKKELGELMGFILLGLGMIALYGMYQAIKGVPVVQSQIDINLNAGMPGRIYATLDNPNNFAEVLAMLLPFAGAALLNARYAISRLFFLGISILALGALVMTLSRSSWIGFAIMMLVFVFYRNKKLIPIMFILAVLAIPVLPQSIYRRLSTITNLQDTSTSYRFSIYSTVWPVFRKYWFTGIGLGTDAFRNIIQNYDLSLTKGLPPVHSHNVTLQVWLETGIFGMLSFVGFLISLVKRGIKAVGSSCDRFIKDVIMAGLASIIGIMVVSMAEYVWFYPRTMLVFWVVAGLTLAALKLAVQEKKADSLKIDQTDEKAA